MSNFFFQRGEKNSRSFRPPAPSAGYGPIITYGLRACRAASGKCPSFRGTKRPFAQKGHSNEVGRNSSVRFDDCSLNVVQDASERLDGHVAATTGVPGLRAAPGLVKQFGSHLHADVIKNTLDL